MAAWRSRQGANVPYFCATQSLSRLVFSTLSGHETYIHCRKCVFICGVSVSLNERHCDRYRSTDWMEVEPHGTLLSAQLTLVIARRFVYIRRLPRFSALITHIHTYTCIYTCRAKKRAPKHTEHAHTRDCVSQLKHTKIIHEIKGPDKKRDGPAVYAHSISLSVYKCV